MMLILEDPAGGRSEIPVPGDALSIGRAADADVRLDPRTVSRRHARLVRRPGAVEIEDLASLTGVRVNGERVVGKRRLFPGDAVEIGGVSLRLRLSPEEEEELRPAEEITSPGVRVPSEVLRRPGVLEMGALPRHAGHPGRARGRLATLALLAVAALAAMAAGLVLLLRRAPPPAADDGVEVAQDAAAERRFALAAARGALAEHRYGEALRTFEIARRAGACPEELRELEDARAEARGEVLYAELQTAAAAQDPVRLGALLERCKAVKGYWCGRAQEQARGLEVRARRGLSEGPPH